VCARVFGAPRAYADDGEMLEHERPDALRAGAHAWIEKPPVASVVEINSMAAASRATGRFVAVGFKKMSGPATVQARALLGRPESGRVATITARYPQPLLEEGRRGDLRNMTSFADHMVQAPSSSRTTWASPPTTAAQTRTTPTGRRSSGRKKGIE
jgi:predicted dehydrogenase